MYHRTFPITPSQHATNGSMDIFLDGCRKGDVSQQLFGLSVLQSATEQQVQSAMLYAEKDGVPRAEIEAMFSRS
jgi:hypothetical protein